MFSAGGWRTLYTLFQMVADGVIDEMRVVQPGWVIGKSFYARQQGIVPDKWRTPRDTNFFMLFQVWVGCAAVCRPLVVSMSGRGRCFVVARIDRSGWLVGSRSARDCRQRR